LALSKKEKRARRHVGARLVAQEEASTEHLMLAYFRASSAYVPLSRLGLVCGTPRVVVPAALLQGVLEFCALLVQLPGVGVERAAGHLTSENAGSKMVVVAGDGESMGMDCSEGRLYPSALRGHRYSFLV
jgi:hypothetical protein